MPTLEEHWYNSKSTNLEIKFSKFSLKYTLKQLAKFKVDTVNFSTRYFCDIYSTNP